MPTKQQTARQKTESIFGLKKVVRNRSWKLVESRQSEAMEAGSIGKSCSLQF